MGTLTLSPLLAAVDVSWTQEQQAGREDEVLKFEGTLTPPGLRYRGLSQCGEIHYYGFKCREVRRLRCTCQPLYVEVILLHFVIFCISSCGVSFFVVLPMIVAVSGPDIDISWCFLFCFCLLFTFVSPRACNQILLVYGLCAVPDHFLELHLVSGSLVLDLL